MRYSLTTFNQLELFTHEKLEVKEMKAVPQKVR